MWSKDVYYVGGISVRELYLAVGSMTTLAML